MNVSPTVIRGVDAEMQRLRAEVEHWQQTVEKFREHACNQMMRRYANTNDYAYWSGRYDVLSTVLEQMAAAATDEQEMS